MSESNKPVADLIAIVERPNDRRSSDFVTLGALWLTEKGHLMGKMNAEPLGWSDRNQPRQVMIRMREGFQVARGNGSASSRSYAGPGAPSPPTAGGGRFEDPPEDDIPFDEEGPSSPA